MIVGEDVMRFQRESWANLGAVVWCWGGAVLLALIVVLSGWVTL